MFKDIKLTTINKLLASALILSCIILGISTIVIDKNLSLIDTSWRQYQADRSEKARLESALRTAIGYGGMVHQFKNFILRHNPSSMAKIHRQIGAAESIINQYRLLQLSDAEITALDDIYKVIEIYEEFHFKIDALIKEGLSISQIDTIVKIDENSLLRGLETLRYEVENTRDSTTALSRARVSADLRGALGYGGMIHNYKNYLLRNNPAYKENAKLSLTAAYQAIEKYLNLNPTYAEELALSDINSTLNNYAKNLELITELINAGKSIQEIDQAVSVDDHLALRGLNTLDKAIHDQIDDNNIAFSKALSFLKSTSKIITLGLFIFLLSVFFFSAWLMQARVISPLLRLTKNMKKLSKSDLSVSLENLNNKNELGEIARSVAIFQENMIERHKAEQKVEKANITLNEQLKNILKLREQSEQQTRQALSLAEGLANARKSAEESAIKAEENELRVSSILNSVQDAIITINTDGIIESVNPATEKMFGYHSSELIGKNIEMLVSESHKNLHFEYVNNIVKSNVPNMQPKPIEQSGLHKDGSTLIVELHITTIKLSDEIKIIGVIKNITERKQWEKELKKLAMTDPLTGLANRNQYNKKLKEAAALSLRSDQPFALMLLDLDKFKPVNDLYGHPIGDLLLQHVSQVLLSCCRETDTVARLGGDEFAIILSSTTKPFDTHTLAQRIIKQICEPVILEENTIQIGISIGISIFPELASDIEALQTQADDALYEAKEGGRNTFRTYSETVKAIT